MNTAQRRFSLAVALVGSLAATGWVASQEARGPDTPRAKEGAFQQPGKSASPARPRHEEPVPAAPEAIMLDKLTRPQAVASAGKLFDSDTWALPPPKAVTTPAPQPTPPALPFRYFGRSTDGAATTVFLDAGERSYAVRVGDVLDGRYKVDDITERTLLLTFLPLQQQQTLSIGD